MSETQNVEIQDPTRQKVAEIDHPSLKPPRRKKEVSRVVPPESQPPTPEELTEAADIVETRHNALAAIRKVLVSLQKESVTIEEKMTAAFKVGDRVEMKKWLEAKRNHAIDLMGVQTHEANAELKLLDAREAQSKLVRTDAGHKSRELLAQIKELEKQRTYFSNIVTDEQQRIFVHSGQRHKIKNRQAELEKKINDYQQREINNYV